MTLAILDGFTVETDNGDKYKSAHLFIRAKFVHEIKFLQDGQVILSDIEFFTGARKELNETEINQLRAAYSELRNAEALAKNLEITRQSSAARQAIAAQEQKLEQFGDPQIFD